MTLDEYQTLASETDQFSPDNSEGIVIALLGLAGESGSLLTLFKKKMRDGTAYEPIQRRVREELGDVLWYVAAIARRSGVSLEQVALANIEKSRARWIGSAVDERATFDVDSPASEQLPDRKSTRLN